MRDENKMKDECEMCGGKPYKEVEMPDRIVTLCEECYNSYMDFNERREKGYMQKGV